MVVILRLNRLSGLRDMKKEVLNTDPIASLGEKSK
jgi:hypothetical protein